MFSMRKQQHVYQNKSSTSHLKKVTGALLDPKIEKKLLGKKKKVLGYQIQQTSKKCQNTITITLMF